MTNNGIESGTRPSDREPVSCRGEPPWLPELLRHMTFALANHVRRLHQEALPVPREVEELTAFLARLARIRQEPSTLADQVQTPHHTRMPDRLLVSKDEAAEQLGASVRTVERLVATGRLRQVHVERLARFRVSDLEAYVNSLADDEAPD
jgi:excisionase family DNA binding protein